MTRDLRTWLPEVTYHCYSRCLEMRALLESVWVQEMACEVINIALEKYTFQLIQIQFVDNHFHFLIRTVEGGENISRIMQYIKARIAENYNRKTGRSGPFWHDRFKCKIIEEARNPSSYYINVALYIGYNRVAKGLDTVLEDSKYNTFRMMIEKNYTPPVKITWHPCFLALGKNHAERVAVFNNYSKTYMKKINTRHMPDSSPPL